MKSLWKKKLYTIHQFKLLNFSNIYLLQIKKKNNEILISNFKVVNRFLPIFNYLYSNNTRVSIYNGKFFYVVTLTNIIYNNQYKNNNFIFSFKFGDLSVTRRMGTIHKSKKRNKNFKKS